MRLPGMFDAGNVHPRKKSKPWGRDRRNVTGGT
jgi:hypothetical protein